VDTTLEFPDRLRLIDDRATAFRAAIAAAPNLDVQVPTCPDWTLFDLARHIGVGRRSWAATIAAGPDARAKITVEDAPPAAQEREALLAWLAASTQQLLDALRQAGPDRGCWTWWEGSQSPKTCGAVARHQLQEIAVHTYDAQLTAGTAQPLPEEVALDGVEDFLFTCVATPSAWPHQPAVIDYHATEGRYWRIWLSPDGARSARLPTPGTPSTITSGENFEPVYVSAEGTASELELFCYDRISMDALKLDGDRRIFDQIIAWDPDA
jgi:uncharacterized protein (TIGR03083 family)